VTEFLRGHVKICGVTTLGDANAAIEAGASSIGFNLAARSPRQLSLDRAMALCAATAGRTIRSAVFRDRDNAYIENALDIIDVEVVQLHDDLDDELVALLRQRGLSIVKALSIEGGEFYDFDERVVDAVLVDGASPGSGVAHSWEALGSRAFSVPVIAAGGLNADNVAATIALTRAWGVDSASGVESSPGVKDRDKLKNFVDNARSAFAREVAR
jgi:phosphoribosylanthranilate isomerase